MVPLPSDVFILIFGHLRLQDILNARQACRDFYELTKSRDLWDRLIHERILRCNIPIPGLAGRKIGSLNAQELEQSLHKALKLHRNWHSQPPVRVRRRNIMSIPDSRVIALHSITEQGRRWLVSLSMSPGRRFNLQCWDLFVSPPSCRAQRELQHFGGISINQGESTLGSIAILNPQLEIMSLDLSAQDSNQGFNTTTMQAEVRTIHAFCGSLFLTSDGTGRLHFWDAENPQIKIELRNSLAEQTILDVILDEKFALVLRLHTLELFVLPSFCHPSNDARNIILNPVSSFQWPWRIDSVSMTPRVQLSKNSDAYDSVGILLRFGSLLPWSINFLHYYELHANQFYTSSSPLNQRNLPYQFPPIPCKIIASPVRLHATSDMSFGSYGTAIWTDTHTNFGPAGRGQRLAGEFLRAGNIQDGEDEEVEPLNQIANAAAASVYLVQEEDSWVSLGLDEAEGRIIIGYNDGRISVLDYV